MPCRLAAFEDTQPKKAEDSADVSILRGKRILLAEDNDLNAEIAIAANMVNMGYDENENASTRIKTDGSTVKIWYDDEQRELRREKRNEDGSLSYYTVVEYTDVTR